MYETIEIERQGPVATLWMNRPEMHNAFSEQLIADLGRGFAELEADASVRVVVLGGRGKSFSAGADLNWMRKAGTYTFDENVADARRLADLLRMLSGMRKPTVARVQGAAFGGGTGLTCACDIAIASTQAQFATTEVKFGIIPGVISPYVVRAIGERQAYRYFQTAERIGAVRAAEIGLVHEAVEPDQLDAKVGEIVAALLTGGPKSQAAAKELIRTVAGRQVDDAVCDDTARRIAALRASDEAKEGISAFLEKRQPSWVNN